MPGGDHVIFRDALATPCEQTDACENITFAIFLFAMIPHLA